MIKVKRGELYYANLCPVVGSEQGGIRPVLIISNNANNTYSCTVIVAAITGKKKKNLPIHVTINADGLATESIVLLEQIRTIDKSRLKDYIGCLDKEAMAKVDKAIEISLGLEYLEELKNE